MACRQQPECTQKVDFVLLEVLEAFHLIPLETCELWIVNNHLECPYKCIYSRCGCQQESKIRIY